MTPRRVREAKTHLAYRPKRVQYKGRSRRLDGPLAWEIAWEKERRRMRLVTLLCVLAVVVAVWSTGVAMAGEGKEKGEPLKIELPLPMFRGTPKTVSYTHLTLPTN